MRQMTVWVVVVLCLAASSEARAQGDRQPPAPIDFPSADFLFGPPHATVGFRGNWLFARAGSDWFSFVTSQLSVDKQDFNAPGFAADVGIPLGRRTEAVIGVDFNQTTTASDYRDFVDNNRLPITQTTRLRTTSLTGSVKYALVARGLEVSRLAWVPRHVVPYVGAGGGALHYDLQQYGDFIDFADNSVFASTFKSAGWAPVAQAFGGVDVRVLKRVYVTLDARYQWSNATLDTTWVDFDPIDLAGFKLAAGATFLF
ncbi:MAG TPA: hypothetical protein VFD69_02710 [Vicinamibacterales bacterium]|nr:hypothetical protein [Vicinamibacterales bacterium]